MFYNRYMIDTTHTSDTPGIKPFDWKILDSIDGYPIVAEVGLCRGEVITLTLYGDYSDKERGDSKPHWRAAPGDARKLSTIALVCGLSCDNYAPKQRVWIATTDYLLERKRKHHGQSKEGR